MTITAQRIEKRRLQHGMALESVVDRTAEFVLILGLIISFAFLLSSSWPGLLVTILGVIASSFQLLFLRCISEHLRLQKKIAGCPYDGRISGQREEVICNCGQMLHSDSHCETCGARIANEDTLYIQS